MSNISDDPLVSLIVPIYNKAPTLARCLDSIRRQSYHAIEVFMVDDGSTDGSIDIIKSYAALDPRFHPVLKEHSGVSDSRNRGIALSHGKYLQFADSDDWLCPSATETFVCAAESSGCDMVISDYYRVAGRSVRAKGHIPEGGKMSAEEFAEYMLKAPANFYYGVMWNKFYRADIVKEHGLLCSDDMSWCEDFQFNLRYLRFVSSVFVADVPLYYYVNTKGSLVNSRSNIRHTAKTKRILFDDYETLYRDLQLDKGNKLKMMMFFFEFARDRTKNYPAA